MTSRLAPYRGVARWLADIDQLNRTMRPSSRCYERFDALARTLTVERIRDCHNLAAAERLEARLRAERRSLSFAEVGMGRGLLRVCSVAEIGELIVVATNRRTLLGMGRAAARIPNPRFDLERIPDHRLDYLIQTYPDLDLVDRCRAEKRRRAMREAA